MENNYSTANSGLFLGSQADVWMVLEQSSSRSCSFLVQRDRVDPPGSYMGISRSFHRRDSLSITESELYGHGGWPANSRIRSDLKSDLKARAFAQMRTEIRRALGVCRNLEGDHVSESHRYVASDGAKAVREYPMFVEELSRSTCSSAYSVTTDEDFCSQFAIDDNRKDPYCDITDCIPSIGSL